MKMLTATRVAALAVGLSLVGAQAFADPSDGRGRGHKNDDTATQQQNTNDQGDRDHRKMQGPKATGNPNPAVAPVVLPNVQNGGRVVQNRNANHVSDNRRGRNDQVTDRRNNNNSNWKYNKGRRDFGNNNDGRNWGKQEQRRTVDVSRYNRNFAAARRFHVATYRQPYGYSYRRYSYGQHLPRSYFGRNFWLSNFLIYGLFSPPPGYIWVRYGPDALLIDEETGEIVQVQYNMFYS